MDIVKGRYFNLTEVESGRNVVILGANVAKGLFPNLPDPIGEQIKIKNLNYRVVGVLKFEGESFLGNTSKDENCYIPYNSFRKLYTTGTGSRYERGSTIGIKGLENDLGLVELESELTGLLRSVRGLKPKELDNFALNRPEAISNMLGPIFDVLGLAGWVIGGFSILIFGSFCSFCF